MFKLILLIVLVVIVISALRGRSYRRASRR
jgi:hypothetical protein